MMMMDATQRAVAAAQQIGHRPGSLPLTDAECAARIARQTASDAKLSAAWMQPPPNVPPMQVVRHLPQVTPPAPPQPLTPQGMQALYERRDRDLTEAWRKA
jgi:hypothetical protein